MEVEEVEEAKELGEKKNYSRRDSEAVGKYPHQRNVPAGEADVPQRHRQGTAEFPSRHGAKELSH
jgi:hypothetical protein